MIEPIDILKINVNRPTLDGNNMDIMDVRLFRALRFAWEKCMGRGANVMAYMSGRTFGKSLNLKTIDEMIEFAKNYKIGIITVVNKNPLQIRVDECMTCSGLPNMEKPLCYFEGGFIVGCLEGIVNKKVKINETHCIGLGDDFCQFEVSTYPLYIFK